MARAFARKFYSSKMWQDCANEYRKKANYLCENCLRRGIYKPGIIVHHIIELTPMNIDIPEIALNYNNLELLCRDCHAKEHELDGGRWSAVNKAKRERRDASNRYTIDEQGKVSAKKISK